MRVVITTIFLCAVCSPTPMAWADDADDTLRELVSKSDSVVAGTITSEPRGESSEAGVVGYSFTFKISEVLHGTQPQLETIRTGVSRFESGPTDRLPFMHNGAACILFLKQ